MIISVLAVAAYIGAAKWLIGAPVNSRLTIWLAIIAVLWMWISLYAVYDPR